MNKCRFKFFFILLSCITYYCGKNTHTHTQNETQNDITYDVVFLISAGTYWNVYRCDFVLMIISRFEGIETSTRRKRCGGTFGLMTLG